MLGAIAAVQKKFSVSAVAKVIEDGGKADDIMRAFWSGIGDAALDEGLRKTYGTVLAKSGEAAAEALAGVDVGIDYRFDLKNPRVQKWIKAHTGDLIKDITADQREAVRNILSRAFDEGFPPRDAAKYIRENVGLRSDQEESLAALEEELRRDEGLSEGDIEKALSRRLDDMLDSRATLIARHETIYAAYEGARESWRQAEDEGLLDPDVAVQQWIAAVDDRVCEICQPYHGLTAALDEEFAPGIYQPGDPHPQCRCGIVMRPYGVGGKRDAEETAAEETAAPVPAETLDWSEEDHPRGDDGRFGDGGGGSDKGDDDSKGALRAPGPKDLDAASMGADSPELQKAAGLLGRMREGWEPPPNTNSYKEALALRDQLREETGMKVSGLGESARDRATEAAILATVKEQPPIVQEYMRKVGFELAGDSSVRSFEVDGAKFTEGGHCDYVNGRMVLRTGGDAGLIAGRAAYVMPHELGHMQLGMASDQMLVLGARAREASDAAYAGRPDGPSPLPEARVAELRAESRALEAQSDKIHSTLVGLDRATKAEGAVSTYAKAYLDESQKSKRPPVSMTSVVEYEQDGQRQMSIAQLVTVRSNENYAEIERLRHVEKLSPKGMADYLTKGGRPKLGKAYLAAFKVVSKVKLDDDFVRRVKNGKVIYQLRAKK